MSRRHNLFTESLTIFLLSAVKYNFIHLYIFSEFHSIKQTVLFETSPYLTKIFDYLGQTHLQIFISLCVYFTENKGLRFL